MTPDTPYLIAAKWIISLNFSTRRMVFSSTDRDDGVLCNPEIIFLY